MTDVSKRLAIVVALLSTHAACLSGGESSGARPPAPNKCIEAYEHALECGAVTAGTPRCVPNAQAACYNRCYVVAGCDDLRLFACHPDGTSGYTSSFVSCMLACEELTFACGSGEELEANVQCDVLPDCEDGSDEVGCPEEPACDQGGPGCPPRAQPICRQ